MNRILYVSRNHKRKTKTVDFRDDTVYAAHEQRQEAFVPYIRLDAYERLLAAARAAVGDEDAFGEHETGVED